MADLGQAELAVAQRLVEVQPPQHHGILQTDEDLVVVGGVRVVGVVGEVVVLGRV